MEAIKSFGRLPKRNKGTSEEARTENKLARRLFDHKDSIPEDTLQELHALGGAPQPAGEAQAMVEGGFGWLN